MNERWHNKLAHLGTKFLDRMDIQGFKKGKKHRCIHCIKTKIHSGFHSTKAKGGDTDMKPGEYIITDIQGPYVRDT